VNHFIGGGVGFKTPHGAAVEHHIQGRVGHRNTSAE
jgi:hypothetical protein